MGILQTVQAALALDKGKNRTTFNALVLPESISQEFAHLTLDRKSSVAPIVSGDLFGIRFRVDPMVPDGFIIMMMNDQVVDVIDCRPKEVE